MKIVTMATAKEHFQLGLLTGFQVFEILGNLHVAFYHKSTDIPVPLADARTKEPRQFKTYDAAINAVRAVGFSATFVEGR